MSIYFRMKQELMCAHLNCILTVINLETYFPRSSTWTIFYARAKCAATRQNIIIEASFYEYIYVYMYMYVVCSYHIYGMVFLQPLDWYSLPYNWIIRTANSFLESLLKNKEIRPLEQRTRAWCSACVYSNLQPKNNLSVISPKTQF